MTIDEAKERFAQVAKMAGDDEAAHSAEDRFHQDVLFAIAHGLCDSPVEVCSIALSTLSLDFCRWCA
jgi:hypothetical protein